MSDPSKARRDSSPEVYSLAQIQHLIRVEFGRAQRYSYPITCVVVAIDSLGALRDRYGYDAKEELVARVIELVGAATRSSDYLGRLPDDRLMIVVPHTPPEEVRELADRLIVDVGGLAVPAVENSPLTLSIGASWMKQGETLFFDDLVLTAERCCEEVSAAGGGQFQSCAPEGL
jgi:diguanylate cyclase (GGDEF)-like protein